LDYSNTHIIITSPEVKTLGKSLSGKSLLTEILRILAVKMTCVTFLAKLYLNNLYIGVD
jgi:hypothetical protein